MTLFRPKVSIVIPVYNGANYLREAIDSALAQTYENIEILVINDGSDDNGQTAAIALSYGDKIQYLSKPNGGVATALNLGIEKMTGEYFSWLSHDDVYYDTKIETQIGYLSFLANKRTILYGGYHIINERSEITGEKILEQNGEPEHLNKGMYPLLNGVINGCTLLIHRDCLISAGLFDTKLKTTQDYALWFKLFRTYPVFFHKEIVLKSRTHSEQGSLKETGHQKEATDLWISFIEETTELDIQDIYNTLPAFYYQMAMRLKYSYVPDAYRRALDKLNEIKYEIKVSVILPTYNRAGCVQNAIDSVLAQTYSQFELIVVDDGSTDNTKELIAGYKDKVTYIHQENLGVSAARNNGIKVAKGQYIAFIDSDDTWTKEHLEKHVQILDESIEYAMTYNRARIIDQNNHNVGKSTLEVNLDENIYPSLLFIKNNIITTPSVLVRKFVMDQVGYFDENMDMCEDLDLWRRIAKRYKVKRIPMILSIIRQRENQFEPNLFFVRRKQYLEKAIAEDGNIPLSTVRELYMELYTCYYFTGCDAQKLYDELIFVASRNDALGNVLKEYIIRAVANYTNYDQPLGIKVIKECLKKIGINPRALKRFYQKIYSNSIGVIRRRRLD